jgi:diguanylate cyclase (GGDEF)-like protein
MKHRSIKWKVLAVALIPAALIAAVLAVHFINSRIADLEQSLQNRGLAIARQLAPASEYGVFAGNLNVLKSLVDAAAKEADVNWVAISDINGDILASSGQGVRLPPVADLRLGLNVAVAGTADALDFSAPIYLSQLAVEDDWDRADSRQARPTHRVIGRVTVEMSRASTQKRKDELLRNGFIITLVGLALSALLAVRMSRNVTRPILRLAKAVEEIGRGRLDLRVPEESGGELQILERGINDMAGALQASQENLQQRIADATSKLTHQASHDALTGLINRTEFEARLERALQSARQGGHTHTLAYLDLDQFKVVNDTCGHVAGDELLRQLSAILQSKLRDRDTLGRLGGDEFGVLLENCELGAAQVIADMLRQTVKDFRFAWQDRSFGVGVSIGLVELNRESGDLSTLLSAADTACYAAKDRGRNRVHVYQEQDGELMRRRSEMQWVTRISRAMEENRFRLYVQPIHPAHLTSSRPIHYEILLRMLDDDGEPLLPMAFIPAAERYNLMPAIDRWVVSNALSFCSQHGGPSPETTSICTINLSGQSLCDEHFLDFVQRQFELNRVPSQRVCFEITETAAITNLAEAMKFIGAMKDKGCQFSLDDFGSGLSSFSYLKNLPVDYLKIDGAFVRDMGADPMDRAMVEAIHHIGHVMGLQTIAEGVESGAILEQLRLVGVDYVQGEWLDAPMPLAQFAAGQKR